jgi:aminoglycoside phosphotransferase family enzyme/predicted kinase
MTEERHPLIDALRSPRAYPHPAPSIELHQTHISWVLLAGEFAYKIKKPVRLPFLDFSTLEKRRFYCEEELRLNRRYAPELYLAVVPICGPPESPMVHGQGEPIEWAVQMRRFPQEAIFARLLERGELTADHIDRLALAAAKFHQSIAVAPEGSPWGTWQNVRRPVMENFEELLAATPSASPLHRRLRSLRDGSAAELERLRDTISARKHGGFIRECHGDMHLGNIVLLPSVRPTIFDGIEFNENLRWIDVQNEIAFPIMDLQERERRPFAWRFLNVYLEATGDYEGLAVLPLYLGYRALVRAKVDWIRGRQHGVEGEARERLEAEFARYVALAESYARPTPPRLFLTHGVSGSGKSYFARRLAEEIGLVQLRSDIERKRLCRDSSGDPAALYSAQATAQTYERLAQAARAALAAGLSVIVDATFLARSRRAQFRALADSAQVPCALLDFRASPETLRQRIGERQRNARDPSDAGLEVLEKQLASRDPLEAGELEKIIPIDTESPEAVSQLLFAVKSAESTGNASTGGDAIHPPLG